jgi:predicted nucleic acid-binding protein
VWSYAFAEDAPESRQETLTFFDAARDGKYELFVSDIVAGEIARASDSLARRLRDLVAELRPVLLDFDEEALGLADAYLKGGAVPPSKVDDARHVAVAVANDLDALVSWNYRHLVNVRRRELFHQISVTNGYYKPLQIVSPPEISDAI